MNGFSLAVARKISLLQSLQVSISSDLSSHTVLTYDVLLSSTQNIFHKTLDSLTHSNTKFVHPG
jgi:hypothetical protein